MTLVNGREYLAIPGPSVIPDVVLREMHRASPNIYEGTLVDMVDGMIPDLCKVARTEHNVAMYIANGHGVWEASLANVTTAGDKVLVPATGRFGHGWADIGNGLGLETEIIDFGKQSPLDPNRVEDALRADRDGRIKAVLVTHTDTSTSIRNDIAGVRAAIDAAGHSCLLMADCIASLACDRFEMDAWGADVMVAASQKGLMVPPGLGFVYFGPRAAEQRQSIQQVSRYWDWTHRANADFFYQLWGGTAPTHHLFGLRAALDLLMAEGMEAVWNRHAILARMIWAACAAWGQAGPLAINVGDPAHRSHAVTSLRIGAPHGTTLRKWLEQNAGVTLGIGLGMSEPDDPNGDGFFRIGHMGHVNAHMVLGMLASLDAGLKSLNIPHGDGAVEAATRVMADHVGQTA